MSKEEYIEKCEEFEERIRECNKSLSEAEKAYKDFKKSYADENTQFAVGEKVIVYYKLYGWKKTSSFSCYVGRYAVGSYDNEVFYKFKKIKKDGSMSTFNDERYIFYSNIVAIEKWRDDYVEGEEYKENKQ